MKNKNDASNTIRVLADVIGKNRTLLLTLTAIVVFVVSYLLVLPALTLDEEEAVSQGGIDVPAAGQEVDQNDTEENKEADAEENDADDEDKEAFSADNAGASPEEMSFEGEGYSISASADSDAQLPDGTELTAHEITEDDKDYEAWKDEALKALQVAGEAEENASLDTARFYDITLLADGQNVEPAAPVNVTISYDKAIRLRADDLRVIHFGADEDGELVPEILDGSSVEISAKKGSQGKEKISDVAFEAPGFSVYAIVEAPEPYHQEVQRVEDLSELGGEDEFYISYNNFAKYWSNTLNEKNSFIEVNDAASAASWYFEPVAGTSDQFYMYTYVDGDKKYLKNTSSVDVGLVDSGGTPIQITDAGNGTFYLKSAQANLWLQHSNSGSGIRFYGKNDTPANCKMTITYASSYIVVDDPYGLDGKTYGLAYHDNSATAAALTADGTTVSGAQRLKGLDMIMRPDVLTNNGVLLVAEGSDIVEWTFHNVSGTDYYITTKIDGQTKYLTIDGKNVTLTDEPDPDKSVITCTPGTNTHSGKWDLDVNGYSLNYSGSPNNGYGGATGSADTIYLNFVERSVLDDDDFTLYTAKKVSVSDEEKVQNGQKVVIYTRIWNETTKRYEFYAVDHDGSLIRCYDTGDNIEWTGSQVNTALWEFTEYYNPDGTANYYYDLKNVQYGNYIAPQVTGSQVFSDNTIGINLNGRRYGESYTSIIAWDENRYAYAGLKTDNGKVVSCPLSQAEDFYFAIITEKDPEDPDDKLTTVNTIDNDEYGIKMKMVDYNNPIQNGSGGSALPGKGGRDSLQTSILGYNTDTAGLLSTDLKEDGYPVTDPNKTHKDGASLSKLYSDFDGLPDGNNTVTDPVNHLFLKSIYDESGYFEYDSTQNFARLNEDEGTFTVYDQIGSIEDYRTDTSAHGQFMPFSDMTEGQHCDYTNRTDVNAQELPDTDARKGETLYNLGKQNEVDYFFGMEMEASFIQTADGLDAWGHDIIFEFSGDDDFWFYVDNELVLDLGGVHKAQTGSINFRTGEVKMSRNNTRTTLYEIFRQNYKTRDLDPSAVDELFDTKIVDGKTVHVFKDYSQHTMKMFYMERGAGSSNLHMRFNLASIKPGTFVLNKKLSGTDNPNNKLIEFPYQIWYTSKEDASLHLLGEKDGDKDRVTYEGGTRKVKYEESYTPPGGTTPYEHVFFLKPGESAVVDMPDDTVDYHVTECGVNPDVYDRVKVNDTILPGTSTQNMVGNTARRDYSTDAATLEERNQLSYDNHVAEGAMRKLTITKNLFDTDGTTRLHYSDDDTEFTYRLYLGNESTSADTLELADHYPYYVKDADGNYCYYDPDPDDHGFKPIKYNGAYIKEYSDLAAYLKTLTEDQRESIVFVTSMYGSISRIPADHTVEVRDLIVDTKFKVEERDDQIPKGYTRRDSDGYVRTDTGHETKQSTPISGTIEVNNDPDIFIQNQIGWGLTVEKIWSDRDFMAQHDDIYFAIYLRETQAGQERLILLPETVRRMKTSETEIYYFLDDLHHEGKTYQFSDYVLREVMLANASGNELQVDDDGVVTITDDITVIPIYDGGTLTVGGTPVGGTHSDGYNYTVGYEVGQSTGQNENIRKDVVTNSRPGIKLYKTDWSGEHLGGAVFTLKDTEGHDVAAETYTSRNSDGLITTAYLNDGTYTLTETAAPNGYIVLDDPMQIKVENNTISVSGPDQAFYEVSHDDPSMAATITIKDRTVDLKVKKVDAETQESISGVHFALYPQVTDQQGNKRKDYLPKEGYEDLVTDENGILPKITMDLAPGTYYLTETATVGEYQLLDEDLEFTIGKDGTVSIDTASYRSWLSRVSSDDKSKVSYSITVPNGKMKKVGVKKISANDESIVLEGASFILYRAEDYDDEKNEPKPGAQPSEEMTTDENGLLDLGNLSLGEYRLVETEAPAGYNLMEDPVKIFVNEDAVTAMQSGGQSVVTPPGDEDDNWRITVWNSSGVELPSSGGPGTIWIYLIGSILLLGCGITLIARRRIRA